MQDIISICAMRSSISRAISCHESGRLFNASISRVKNISQNHWVDGENQSGALHSISITGSGNDSSFHGHGGNFLCGSSLVRVVLRLAESRTLSVFMIGDSSIISSGVTGRYFQSQYRICISSGSLNHNSISS